MGSLRDSGQTCHATLAIRDRLVQHESNLAEEAINWGNTPPFSKRHIFRLADERCCSSGCCWCFWL